MRCGAHWRQDSSREGPRSLLAARSGRRSRSLWPWRIWPRKQHSLRRSQPGFGDACPIRVLARPRLNHPEPVATAARTHLSRPGPASIITAGGWCAPLCAGAPALQRPGAAKPQPSRFRPWLGFARPLNPASHMALHRPAAEPDVHQRQPGTDACQRRLDQAPRGYWPGCRPSAHRRTDALKRGEGC